MKWLFKKVLIFISILVLYKTIILIVILFTLSNSNANRFYGESSNKPKIVLVGSSNLEHNYDFTFLNEYYSDYNVIGCNLNEPSGFYSTIFKLKKLNVNEQDIIIICFPHSLYESDKFFPLNSSNKRGFTKKLLSENLKEFPFEFLKSIVATNVIDAYKLVDRIGFNNTPDYDTISFQKNPSIQLDSLYKNCWSKKDEKLLYIQSQSLDKKYLKKIHAYLDKEFESTVLFRYPSMKEDEFDISIKRISFLSKNFQFINSFESSLYNEEFWFNEKYHMNSCGRDLNTQNFIKELETFVKPASIR